MTKSLLLLSLIFVSKAYAVESESQPRKKQQKIELQTTISGAEEEPKFMSILPWQDLEKVQLTNLSYDYCRVIKLVQSTGAN